MQYLRKNTAVRICVGPFLDVTDGFTPELSLTTTNCHITMILDDDDGTAANLIIDADATASGGDNDMVHITDDNAGFYDLELTAAQTNYNGRVRLAITDTANHRPVVHEFAILPATTYDALITNAAGAANGLLIAGSNAATTFATLTVSGAATLNSLIVSTTTTLTGNVTLSGTLGVSAVTFASLAVTGALSVGTTTTLTGAVTLTAGITANAITGTLATVTNLTNLPAITTGWLTAAGIHADAVTEIQSGLATAAAMPSAADNAAEVDTVLTAAHGVGSWVSTGTAGAGAVSTTVTIQSGGVGLAGVELWVTDITDVTTIAGTLLTDSSGDATFLLDAGTYHLWKHKPGYNFTTNPETLIVV